MLRLATGGRCDLVRAGVRAALGMDVGDVSMPQYDGLWCQQILHSGREGVFRGVRYAPGFREAHVADEQLWAAPGERVGAFSGANNAFGSVMLRFDGPEELDAFRADPSRFMEAEVL